MAFCVVKPFPALSMPRDTNSAILHEKHPQALFSIQVPHTKKTQHTHFISRSGPPRSSAPTAPSLS